LGQVAGVLLALQLLEALPPFELLAFAGLELPRQFGKPVLLEPQLALALAELSLYLFPVHLDHGFHIVVLQQVLLILRH
jgi:hypothetical protein